jgi:hypothetical protein
LFTEDVLRRRPAEAAAGPFRAPAPSAHRRRERPTDGHKERWRPRLQGRPEVRVLLRSASACVMCESKKTAPEWRNRVNGTLASGGEKDAGPIGRTRRDQRGKCGRSPVTDHQRRQAQPEGAFSPTSEDSGQAPGIGECVRDRAERGSRGCDGSSACSRGNRIAFGESRTRYAWNRRGARIACSLAISPGRRNEGQVPRENHPSHSAEGVVVNRAK